MREHRRGDHMTTTVGNDKRQERAADGDSNEEGKDRKGDGNGNEDAG